MSVEKPNRNETRGDHVPFSIGWNVEWVLECRVWNPISTVGYAETDTICPGFCVAQMLRLRIAIYRHLPTRAVEKCFQLQFSFFFFWFVFFRFSGQLLNFLFRHSLFFFFFFFFWGFSGQVLNFFLFTILSLFFLSIFLFWFSGQVLNFFFLPFSLFCFFLFFLFGFSGQVLNFFFFKIFPFSHFSLFFPHYIKLSQFHSIAPLLLIFKTP